MAVERINLDEVQAIQNQQDIDQLIASLDNDYELEQACKTLKQAEDMGLDLDALREEYEQNKHKVQSDVE